MIWGVFWLDECDRKCCGLTDRLTFYPIWAEPGHSNSASPTNTNTETAIVAVD